MLEVAAGGFILFFVVPAAIRVIFAILEAIGNWGARSGDNKAATEAEVKKFWDEYYSWDAETQIRYHVYCRLNKFKEAVDGGRYRREINRRVKIARNKGNEAMDGR